MKTKYREWDRLLWAVEMSSKSCRPEGMLIGVSWDNLSPPSYGGEPSRALLFAVRKHAKTWCDERMKACKTYGPDWKFKPVRVRETLTRV
tara:strand:- start:120 stop:389 length:270 start_codon:yes stop_codon:yes gene_type:complete